MNKTAFITGSSRGIGKAIARHFCRIGFNVAINGVDEGRLAAAERELLGLSDNVLAVRGDLADYPVAESAINVITRQFGGIDILVNNAAILHVGLFTDMQPREWRRLIDVNIGAMLNCTHLVLPQMYAKKSGCVVNISSVWGERGASCEAVYSMTKGAVNGFTKAIAKEAAPSGIRVNAVACGVIDTEMNAFLNDGEKTALTEKIGLSRFGLPEEIADAVVFLSSEKASYLTGQIITVDGLME